MFSKRKDSPFQTVTFRLTFWHAALFGGLSLVVFLVVYVSLTAHLRQQTDTELLNMARAFDMLYQSRGAAALQAEFRREAKSKGRHQVFFRLLSPAGKLLAASDLRQWDGLATRLPPPFAGNSQPVFRTIALPAFPHRLRVVAKPVAGGKIIEVGASLQATEIMMERYRETFGTALVIMLGCGGLVGWLLARKAMAGVHRVTRTATRIGKENLSRRVPAGNEGREINALAQAVNGMLERIESLVKELQQITDNVAHELRTPVTRIRGLAETTLNGRGGLDEHRDMAAAVIEASDQLIEMINTMLEIARTGPATANAVGGELDLRRIAAEAADLFQPLAEDKGVAIQLRLPGEALVVTGERARLQRAIANLLDNAIKYTPAGGTVTISLTTGQEQARVSLADTGQGIDDKDLAHVFDRFYRGDKSRSTPGSGLGLSLALAIVRAHGGGITVHSAPGRGSTFTILLPLAKMTKR